MTDKPKNPVRDRIMKESSDVIGLVYDELVVKSGSDASKLPEPIFIEQFLPLFTGQIKREDRPELLSQWIGIAGSAVSEVSVIDQSGQELFRVPAIFDTSFVTKGAEGHRYDHLINKANLLSNHLPAKGERFLTQALEKKLEQMDGQSHHPDKDEQRWRKIFDRYHIEDPSGKAASNASGQSSSDIIDDEIYD